MSWSSGTTGGITQADGDTRYAQLGAANTFTVGPQSINTGAATNKGLVLTAFTGQSALMIDLRNATPTTVFRVDVNGQVRATGVSPSTAGSPVWNSTGNFQTGAGGIIFGTATTDKLGFWNATAVVQPTAVADASGGAVIDGEARTAINAVLARLRTTGFIAT